MVIKSIWFDVDGVLLDWVRPFLQYIKSDKSYDELTQYDFSNLFDGSIEKMVKAINRFNSTFGYACLQPLVSKEELQGLKDKGYSLNIISQVDGNYARHLRLINLEHVFGFDMFHTVILTSRKDKKVDILRKLEPYERILVIEDNPAFVRDALKDGHIDTIAIRHPYNAAELKQYEVIGNMFQLSIAENTKAVIGHLMSVKI